MAEHLQETQTRGTGPVQTSGLLSSGGSPSPAGLGLPHENGGLGVPESRGFLEGGEGIGSACLAVEEASIGGGVVVPREWDGGVGEGSRVVGKSVEIQEVGEGLDEDDRKGGDRRGLRSGEAKLVQQAELACLKLLKALVSVQGDAKLE